MNRFERDVVSALFTAITSRLEDAQPFAVKGQSRRKTPADYATFVKIISVAALEVATLVEAIGIVVGSSTKDDPQR
jgi:hypothetical protein